MTVDGEKYKVAYRSMRGELHMLLAARATMEGHRLPPSMTIDQSVADLGRLLLAGSEPAGQFDGELAEAATATSALLPHHMAEIERAKESLSGLVYTGE